MRAVVETVFAQQPDMATIRPGVTACRVERLGLNLYRCKRPSVIIADIRFSFYPVAFY